MRGAKTGSLERCSERNRQLTPGPTGSRRSPQSGLRSASASTCSPGEDAAGGLRSGTDTTTESQDVHRSRYARAQSSTLSARQSSKPASSSPRRWRASRSRARPASTKPRSANDARGEHVGGELAERPAQPARLRRDEAELVDAVADRRRKQVAERAAEDDLRPAAVDQLAPRRARRGARRAGSRGTARAPRASAPSSCGPRSGAARAARAAVRISCSWRRSRSGERRAVRRAASGSRRRRSGWAAPPPRADAARAAGVSRFGRERPGECGRDCAGARPVHARGNAPTSARRSPSRRASEQVGEAEAEVAVVAGEHLVAALAVEHHREPGLASRPASRTTARRCSSSRTARPGPRRSRGGLRRGRRPSNETQCGSASVCSTTASANGRSSKPRSSKYAVKVCCRSPTGARVLRLGAEQVVDGDGDRRRVEPAGEARADRHVAAQAQSHRVEQQLAHGLGRVAGGRVARPRATSTGRAAGRLRRASSECAGGSFANPAKNVSSVWSR